MSMNLTPVPVARQYEPSAAYAGLPEIAAINYDLWLLRITAHFPDLDHPVYVTFDAPRGFRVLDEGDLLEFWDKDVRADGWLWQVDSGGWLDLESSREGFVSGLTGGYSEYLILGQHECLSVITNSGPTIGAPRP